MSLRDFTAAEVQRLFESRIQAADPSIPGLIVELQEYRRAAFRRILRTLQLCRKFYTKDGGDILEIGSFPFFFSLALITLGNDRVRGVSAPDSLWPGEASGVTTHSTTIKTMENAYPYSYDVFNVEKDRFPHADGSFDMVLCCEVLEHLIQQPAQMLFEINRVLKDGGILVLTMPNGLYWKYVYKLFFMGIWEQYSPYGVYGRHNRLWAANEAIDLLRGNNFEVLFSSTEYAQEKKLALPRHQRYTHVEMIQDIAMVLFSAACSIPVPFFRKKDGDQLYFVLRKIGPPKRYEPPFLYFSKISYDREQ